MASEDAKAGAVNRRPDGTEHDIHQESHITLHKLFRQPARNSADDNGCDPTYLWVFHSSSSSNEHRGRFEHSSLNGPLAGRAYLSPAPFALGQVLGLPSLAVLIFDGNFPLLSYFLLHIPTVCEGRSMEPELRRVVLRLVITGFAFAIVLAIARVHPVDLEAPGLKFVSPGVSRK